MKGLRLFTVIDAAMLRLATQPSNAHAHDWPDLAGENVRHWRDWLSRTWADETFAVAVAAASPELARMVTAVCGGSEQRPRRVRRAVVSVLRYRLRASSRATPFGLFAGVAPAAFGPATSVRVGDDHRLMARVATAWLAGVVTELERCPGLVERLPVVVNNSATVRDERLVIGLRQDPGSAKAPAGARTDPAEVSIRYTAAVELIVQTACTPIRLGDLADRLAAAFPATTTSVITAMLRQLLEQRVLISKLRPPMTVTDPLAHLLTTLAESRAEEVPAAAGLLAKLHTLTRERAAVGYAGPVDLRADADVVLPREVASEVARAAEVLTRLTPHPFGKPAWLDYHARFLEHYGIGAAVPLLEVVNPDIGLGLPAGYRGSLLEHPTPQVSGRDSALMRLAQTAGLDRRVEVVLDDSAISEFEKDSFERAQFAPHTELAVRIHVPNRAALDRGDFTVVVAGAFRTSGTTTGRFLDLLDPAERDRVSEAYAGLPTVNERALRVQTSCPPLYAETENVARSPQLLPHVLSISEHRPGADDVLVPDDLLVVGDVHRFYLWSRSKARPIEPEVLSAVEFTTFAHPLLRFACELTTARAAACRPFSWGTAEGLPFLPRLTYRRTVLSPARWSLSAGDLPGRDASWPAWTTEVTSWRERMMVPDAIYLGDGDQRIRLDLDEPAHLHLLRAQLDRYGHATVHEAPADDANGWLSGHAHEIVVPLASTHARTWPPTPVPTAPINATTSTDGHLPGTGAWLYCKLYGHPDRHGTLLTTHLPALLSTLDGPAHWWFLPYRDPDNHLRLRIRLASPQDFGQVAARLGTWAEDLRRLGLIATMQLDTYRPETGRFGHGQAMTAAEAVFAADSAAATVQRAHLTGPDAADAWALTAASLLNLASAFTGDHEAGAAWVIEHVSIGRVSSLDRAVYDQALHLADPNHDAVRRLPGGDRIAAAWARRRTEVSAYRNTLSTAGGPAPDGVLASLLHLHCLRTSGIAPDNERICHRLARAAALHQSARPKTPA